MIEVMIRSEEYENAMNWCNDSDVENSFPVFEWWKSSSKHYYTHSFFVQNPSGFGVKRIDVESDAAFYPAYIQEDMAALVRITFG